MNNLSSWHIPNSPSRRRRTHISSYPHPFYFSLRSTSIDGCVRLWDTRTSQCQAAKWGHTKGVLDFAPSPDFKSVVTASDDHTARVFQMVQ